MLHLQHLATRTLLTILSQVACHSPDIVLKKYNNQWFVFLGSINIIIAPSTSLSV